jgi:hypothetical protein
MDNFWTVLITFITVIGSTSAFKFYERRMEKKHADENFGRLDCAQRISRLETMLEKEQASNKDLNEKILILTKQVVELSVRLELMQKQK